MKVNNTDQWCSSHEKAEKKRMLNTFTLSDYIVSEITRRKIDINTKDGYALFIELFKTAPPLNNKK